MHRNTVAQIVAFYDLKENFTITGHSSDDMVAQIHHRHLTIYSWPAHAAKFAPCAFNDVISSPIKAIIRVSATNLDVKPVFAYDINPKKLKITTEIFIISLQISTAIACC